MSQDYSGLSYEEAFPLKLLEMLQAGRAAQARLVKEREAQNHRERSHRDESPSRQRSRRSSRR
jgi:hypothetical protein